MTHAQPESASHQSGSASAWHQPVIASNYRIVGNRIHMNGEDALGEEDATGCHVLPCDVHCLSLTR
jgi:hypothetical protein